MWQWGLAGCWINGELWHKPCRFPKLLVLYSAMEEAGGDQSHGLDLHFLHLPVLSV